MLNKATRVTRIHLESDRRYYSKDEICVRSVRIAFMQQSRTVGWGFVIGVSVRLLTYGLVVTLRKVPRVVYTTCVANASVGKWSNFVRSWIPRMTYMIEGVMV